MLDISAVDLLTTTRAVRRRLDLTRPVPREIVMECLRIATRAPNASNRQDWRFVVIDDPEVRATVAHYYRLAYRERRREAAAQGGGADELSPVERSAEYLAENLSSVPIVVIPCLRPRRPLDSAAAQATAWGSILPATWSFMLAARLYGLGTTLTTVHLRYAQEVGAVIGIPAEVIQAGLVPVAYSRSRAPRPAPRAPVEDVVDWNRWQPDR